MATTDYPVNHPMAVAHWQRDLMKEALKRTWGLGLMGRGADSVIQMKTDMKQMGDNVTIGLRMQLNGAGVAGDGTLEGNEEPLVIYTDDVRIDQLRHAVRSRGRMSEQRVPFSVREEARDGLADWWADRIDTALFRQLAGDSYTNADTKFTGSQPAIDPIASGDTAHVYYPTGNSEADVVADAGANGKMTLQLIDRLRTKATLLSPPIRPVRVDGGEYYMLFLHPLQVEDLRTNTNTGQWLDIQKAAMNGGQVTGNPIFSGALGMYNMVVIREAIRIPLGNTTSKNLRRAVFCGAQAAAVAFGRDSSAANVYSWVESLFDYENQLGVSAGAKWGLKKLRFNNRDFATIIMPTYTTGQVETLV